MITMFLTFEHHKKECALAHSRAERGRLRHVSASRECAYWHVSAFLCNREFQGISYYTKKGSNLSLEP